MFDVLDVLVDLVSAVDQLDELDAEGREVRVELLAVVGLYLVVDEGDAALERLVDVGEDAVLWVKHVPGDFDRGSQSSRHDGFDRLRVGGSERQTVAVAVD